VLGIAATRHWPAAPVPEPQPREHVHLAKISNTDYRSLAAFRFEIRKFLAFSEGAARTAGIEPQQHQLLLVVRGLPAGARPTIRVVSERLCVKHHTAVALVDKLEDRGLLLRERGSEDRREVLLRLTSKGDAMLRELSALHRAQLRTVGPAMVAALQSILGVRVHGE
jgi:DNA-binding MarR family transcriptional regulator